MWHWSECSEYRYTVALTIATWSNKVWVYTCSINYYICCCVTDLTFRKGTRYGCGEELSSRYNLLVKSSGSIFPSCCTKNTKEGSEERKIYKLRKQTERMTRKVWGRGQRDQVLTEMVKEREMKEMLGKKTEKKKKKEMYQQVLDQLLDVGCSLRGLFSTGCQLDQRRQKVSTLFYILQRLLQAHTHKNVICLYIKHAVEMWGRTQISVSLCWKITKTKAFKVSTSLLQLW